MTINLNEYIGTSVAIPLAKQGEYGKEVTFDFSAWAEMFGSGSIGWSIQRPQDTAAYLLPSTEDGTVSTITLTETESQNSGYGLLEVFYVNTGETEKRISQTFSIRIDKSLQNVGEAPSPWQSYVDAVHADALAAEEAASSVLGLTAEATVDANVGTPSVSVEVTTEDDHKNMAFAFSNIKGEQGEQGKTGNGISSVSVAKTATVGNVDTYTMTIAYTDGDSDTATYDVINGEVTEEEFEKAFPTDTASGSIASYPDGADMPVKDLKVSVTPVQDLHGYANPWVGGGGKNLFDASAITTSHNGITATVSDGTITLNGTAGSGNSYLSVTNLGLTSATGFTWSANNPVANSGVHLVLRDIDNTYKGDANLGAVNKTNAVATATSCKTFTIYVVAGTELTNFVLKPQLEYGSSATSYAPYSNICPITGWTGANVVRTGVNVWDEQWEVGRYNSTTGAKESSSNLRSTNYISVKPSTTYYLKCSSAVYVYFYKINKEFISRTSASNGTFTTPSDAYYITFYVSGGYGTTYNSDISINYPSTDHAYHAYSGNTYSIPFGQTVYGGTLDVTSGVLTIDRAYDLLNNANLWETNSWGFRYNQDVSLPRKIYDNSFIGLICSVAPVSSSATWTARWNSAGGSKVGFVNGSGAVTLEQVKSLATNGQISVVYELASPQSVQLSPTEVKSLLGNNNIFADCGDSEVEYLADVTLYIQKLTGSTEDDMVANQNIANNKYFMVGNRLFFSTSAIAQGASIMVGTNCTETNLADALNALNS